MVRPPMYTLAALAVAAAPAAHASLVHQYTFNDGTGNDSVGTAHGTVAGSGVSFAGNQMMIDGSVGSFLDLPDNTVDGITGSFTIEVFLTHADPNGSFATIFSFSSDTNNFLLANAKRPNTGNTMTSNFRQSPDGEFVMFGSGIGAPTNTPFVYTLAYDASDNGGTAYLYLDGVQVATGNGGSISGFDLDAAASGGLLGIGGNAPFADPSFLGSFDEFRIYDSYLTPSQVLASAQAGPVIPEPGSLALLGLGGLALVRRRR